MKLSDLSDINRRILVVLKDIHCGGRRHIAELAGLQPHQVSPALNRLEGMGFIDHPAGPGAGWTMSDAGYALFGLRAPVAVESAPDQEPESNPECESETPFPDSCGPEYAKIPEPEPEPEPVSGPYAPAKSAEIMRAMEIELALEQVRGRLRIPAIPASSVRVYREIISALPKVLVEALAPITAMVDAHG
jgi:hypothetical protein